MSSYIDLHMHSVVSGDGEFSAKQLVERAKKVGLKYMAISDHDCVSSIADGLKYAKQEGIVLIPAVEICTEMNDGTELHVLGYNIDFNDFRFIEREKKVSNIFLNCTDDLIKTCLNAGFKFEKENVLKKSINGYVTEEMIGETILEDSRNDDDPRLLDYRNNGPKSDNPGFNFYKQFCCQGQECYTPLPDINMNIKDVSELIHSTNGFMVLAHPAHNIKKDLSKLEEIYSYGLDGIEVFSSYHTKEDIEFYNAQADRLNFIKTVGSDFHGRCKPSIEMGSIDCNEDEILKGLKKFVCID